MNEPFAVGAYLCVFYQPFSGNPAKNDRILEECAAHPERFTLPMTRNDIRTTAAWYLTDPENFAWEVWKGGAICGILLIDRVVPQIDARLHFVFFDGLLGKRALLEAFIQRAFEALKFQRLSLEIPETEGNNLVNFARRKLGFDYEGKSRQGSRRERSYFDGAAWRDVILLRRLACP